MRKDQFNKTYDVTETGYSDVIETKAYRAGVVQSKIDLVDENENLTTPTIKVIAEVSLDGVNYEAITFDSGEKTESAAVDLKRLLDSTDEDMLLYLRYKWTVGGTGYQLDQEDPDDDAFWRVNLNTLLND